MPYYRAAPCPACTTTAPDADDTDTLWRLSGVSDPERLRCTLMTWNRAVPGMRAAFAAAADWGQGKGPPFLLLSSAQRGVGKTHLAIAAAAECIARGGAVRYLIVPQYLDALRSTQRPDATTRLDDARRPAETYPALVLDDLGAGRPTDWAEEQLFTIVNERWRRELRTFVTTNVAADAIEPRTRSRLTDARLGRVVVGTGSDYRQHPPDPGPRSGTGSARGPGEVR